MYDALQLGPLTIQYILLIYIASIFITYLILDGLIPESMIKAFYKQHYLTFWFILFITYKFSIILFEPQLLVTTKWIFFTGGKNGFYIGLVVGVLFLVWRMRKENMTVKFFIISLFILILSFAVIFQLMKFVLLSVL